MKAWFSTAASVAVAAAITAAPAHAVDFSFTGNFLNDDDVQFFNFIVGGPSDVTFRTYSYAGGTQADGNVVAAGGFDPILAVFDLSTGNQIAQNDDGFGVPADPVTGAQFDTLLELILGAGNYSVSVMQYDNFANGDVGDGFARSGQPFFTSAFGCSNGQFCDVAADNRTNFWAFDILNVDQAVVVPPTQVIPLPATLPLFLAALGGLALAARRRTA